MKRMMKLLLVFVMAAALTACGAKKEPAAGILEGKEEPPAATTEETEETPAATIDAQKEAPFATVEAADGFHNAGYVEIISGAEASAEYTFTAEDSEAVEWLIYILDEAFEDGFRYIAQAAEPALVGDGTLFVDAGKYVYVYCSANEFTTGVVNENAKLNITVK